MHSLNHATVVFDLDGTIVDTAPDLIGALNHVLGAEGMALVAAAAIRPMIAFGARRMIEASLRLNDVKATSADLDRLLAIFLVHYEGHIADMSRPFAGVEAALGELSAHGVKLGVCTNKREALSLKLLRALDLERFFGAIVGRDTLAVWKPHPGHLTGTVARLGGRMDRAVMVGDSEVDIATAKAAGAPVVAVSFGYTHVPIETFGPDRVIDHFDQLTAVLADLIGRPGLS